MKGTFPHEEGDGGCFTGSVTSNYYRFLRGKCIKGENVYHPAFKMMGCKKIAIYRVIWSVDARMSVEQEGLVRLCKLTKAQEKKVTF